jgi:hypothetical protein
MDFNKKAMAALAQFSGLNGAVVNVTTCYSKG